MVLCQLLLNSLWIYSVTFSRTIIVFFNKEKLFSQQTRNRNSDFWIFMTSPVTITWCKRIISGRLRIKQLPSRERKILSITFLKTKSVSNRYHEDFDSTNFTNYVFNISLAFLSNISSFSDSIILHLNDQWPMTILNKEYFRKESDSPVVFLRKETVSVLEHVLRPWVP